MTAPKDTTPNPSQDELREQIQRWVYRYAIYVSSGGSDDEHTESVMDVMMQDIDTYTEEKVRETAKAYGGCTNCYGKGYATQKSEIRARQWRLDTSGIVYCNCSRGEQLEAVIKALTNKGKGDE